MKELFARVTVVCAAVTAFGSGAYVVSSGVSSIVESHVRSVALNMSPGPTSAAESAADVAESTDALLQSIKKLGKSLSK